MAKGTNYLFLAGLICVLATKGQQVINKCVNDRVILDCSIQKHCFVRIVSAYYGHPHRNRLNNNCTFTMGHCITNATDVWSKCNGNRKCDFHVRQSREEVRPVCVRTSEYLTVTYECKCTEPCEAVAEVENARITYSAQEIEHGASVTYACQDGFRISGPTVRTCTSEGTWTDIQPTCSLPLSSCLKSNKNSIATTVTTYKTTCLELSERSFTSNETDHLCTDRGALLLNITSKEKLDFIGWWLDQNSVQGYVWISGTTNIDGDLCVELYKDATMNGAWRQRAITCSYRNHYICEYEGTGLHPPRDSNKTLGLELAIGLGVSLAAVIIIIAVIIIVLLKQRKYKRDLDNLTMIPPTPSTSSCNLAEQEYIYSNEIHTSPRSNNNITNTLQGDKSPDGSSDTSAYDDVYIPEKDQPTSNNSHVANGDARPKIKPPIKRKPRLAGARLYTKHTYENVALHNLTESLKRRFLPRRSSSVKAKKESKGGKQINETNLSIISSKSNETKNCECSDCPVPPQRTVSNQSNSQFKNGKCKFCGKRNIELDNYCNSNEHEVEYSTVLVSPGKRRSSGLRVIDNELYDRQISESQT